MKSKIYTLVCLGFLGIALSLLTWNCTRTTPPSTSSNANSISQEKAQQYIKNFQADTANSKMTKTIYLDRQYLDIMNELIKNQPDATGFTIQYGIDSVNMPIMIISANGNKNQSNNSSTATPLSCSKPVRICPPLCDSLGG